MIGGLFFSRRIHESCEVTHLSKSPVFVRRIDTLFVLLGILNEVFCTSYLFCSSKTLPFAFWKF